MVKFSVSEENHINNCNKIIQLVREWIIQEAGCKLPRYDLFHREIGFYMYSVNYFVQIQTDKTVKMC